MYSEKGILKAAMGQFNGEVINDTDEHTPTAPEVYICIMAIEDSEVTAVGNIDGLTSISVPAGLTIPGKFTSVTLGSGSVIVWTGE
jgi:hypothetical protein